MKKLIVLFAVLLSLFVANGVSAELDLCVMTIRGIGFFEKEDAQVYLFTLFTHGSEAATRFVQSVIEEGQADIYSRGQLVILLEQDRMLRHVKFMSGLELWVTAGASLCRGH